MRGKIPRGQGAASGQAWGWWFTVRALAGISAKAGHSGRNGQSHGPPSIGHPPTTRLSWRQ